MLGRNAKEQVAHELGVEAGKIGADAFPKHLSAQTYAYSSNVAQENGLKKTSERTAFFEGYGTGFAEGKIEQVRNRHS